MKFQILVEAYINNQDIIKCTGKVMWNGWLVEQEQHLSRKESDFQDKNLY